METRTEDFRRTPPAPLAPRQLNLPVPVEETLDNGLRIVVVESPRLPLVSYRLALRVGNAYDPPDLPGLADLTCDVLMEGTETRTSRQIAEEVARYGASLSAGASSDYSTVAASCLSFYSREVFELLADVALRPSFPENELALARANAHQNLIAQRAQPSFLANEALARVVFGRHPYGSVAPTHEAIDGMTRQTMQEFHGTNFLPNNSVLFVVGDVRRDEVLGDARRLFGTWRLGSAREPRFPAPPERDERVAYVVNRPGSEQSNIVIANLAITRTDSDYFPLLVMHTILGANASARLFMNLREEKGYTYGAYSVLDARAHAGTFRATAEVRTPVTGASLEEFFKEFARIRDEDVSAEELKNAKSYLSGVFAIRLETQEGLTDQLVQAKMYDLPDDYLHSYRESVRQVSVEDVRRAAGAYLRPDEAAIVVVGDADAIIEQVKPHAARVEFVNGDRQAHGAGGESAAAGVE